MLPLIESAPLDDQQALLEAARVIEAKRAGLPTLSAEDLAANDRGLDDARQGRFASAEAVEAVRAKIRGA